MPPVTITLFEHQQRTYSEIDLYPQDMALRERVLARVERLNEINKQEILHLGRKGLRANALVGVIRAGEVSFEILPKIDYADFDETKEQNVQSRPGSPETASHQPVNSATRNFLYLLSYAYGLRLYAKDIASLETQSNTWLDLLTHLFAAGLCQEILSGLSQHYISREENLQVLRGRWDVQRQFRRSHHSHPSFDVIYDELSADIPLNQVFHFVIEKLLATSQDPHNQVLLRNLAEWFRPVTLLSQLSPDFLAEIHFTRLNERFQPVFNLARLFLSGNTIQVTAGDQTNYAFVFDMNMLFECFIAGFLTRHRQQILPAEWQDVTVLPQSEGAGLYLARLNGKNVFRLRPDLLFNRHNQPAPVLVADTKYKQLNRNHSKPGIDPEDVYQMLAYSIRYQCPHGLLLYPQIKTNPPTRLQYEISTPALKLFAATLNLHTPLQQPDRLIEEFHGILQSFNNLPIS
jgi:5-methylcytosine-specific restriction enzyme subunit McrC